MLTSSGQPPVLGRPRATLDDWGWQRHGHCVGVPSEVFFPEDEKRRQRRRREAQAKLICEGCPVLRRAESTPYARPRRMACGERCPRLTAHRNYRFVALDAIRDL
jgi:hypothetical protein